MLHSWCNDSVTVRRAPWRESRGTRVRDWDAASESEVRGCSVQPASTARDFAGRAQQEVDRWTLYAPPGADVQAGDRIAWNGFEYEVEGRPYAWRSPTGRVSHLRANLVEWSG